jgi:hypothetical protein
MPYTVQVGANPLAAATAPAQGYQSERRLPLVATFQYRQGTTFKSEVATNCATTGGYCFTAFAQPTARVESSVGSAAGPASRTVTTTYKNDIGKWVIGLVEKRGCLGNADCGSGLTLSRTDYDLATLLPWKEFGVDQVNPVATYAYGASGLLTSAKDARNNQTSVLSYSFGTPTSLLFADGTSFFAGSPAGARSVGLQIRRNKEHAICTTR